MKIHASLSYNHSFYGPGWIWGPNDTLSDTASLAERYHGDRRATHTQFTEPPSKCICIGIPIYNASIYCTHICLPVPMAGAWRIIIACCPIILLRVLCSGGLAVAFYSPAAQHPISSMHLPPLSGGVVGAVQKQGEVVRPFCSKPPSKKFDRIGEASNAGPQRPLEKARDLFVDWHTGGDDCSILLQRARTERRCQRCAQQEMGGRFRKAYNPEPIALVHASSRLHSKETPRYCREKRRDEKASGFET